MAIVDVDKQKRIKDYIDDLVYAMYFNVPLPSLGIENAAAIKVACQNDGSDFYSTVRKPGV